MRNFTFNKEKHYYELDGKRLYGVTTILSVLAKPALIQWSANMAIDFIQVALNEKLELTPELLKDARNAHRKKKETAGDWGTEMHAWIEKEVKARISKEDSSLLMPTDEKQKECAENFLKWIDSNKVTFLESEKHLYSKDLFLGGIVDLVCEIDGQVWIVDVKTGSGIYFEAFWQMGGYELLLKEMGFEKPVTGYIVLNLKKDGTFTERRSISNEDNKKGFLACLDIYRISEKVKNQII